MTVLTAPELKAFLFLLLGLGLFNMGNTVPKDLPWRRLVECGAYFVAGFMLAEFVARVMR